MLFRALDKGEFKKLVETILAKNEVVGPKRVGTKKDGKPIHHFLPVTRFDELALDYDTTEFSAKTYFLPYRENMSTFTFDNKGDWQQSADYHVEPRAIIGLHACDINSLLKLDKVLVKDRFPSPYYISRRRNTFIVGIDHEPCADSFCRIVGADTVTRGFDLYLTDLGKHYFVAVGSDRGMAALDGVTTRLISDEDTRQYMAVRKRYADMAENSFNIDNLPNLLDIEFESPVWKKYGSKCLSCGSCANVCPTCYCYGVHERIAMDFKSGEKIKQLHSCNLVDFALVAGGHNFRPSAESRLKYRYYHQHRGFVETYDEPKCVGCNRCGRACLAGINPPDVIRDLQAEGAR
jgi:sulfhydrogenase subunit beta (sulfur reductase)